MLFIILSLLDLVAGAAIYSPRVFGILSVIMWTLTIVVLFKGIFSVASSFSEGYFFEWPGALDIVAGISLFLLAYSFISPQQFIGGLVIGKGAYYLTRSVLGV